MTFRFGLAALPVSHRKIQRYNLSTVVDEAFGIVMLLASRHPIRCKIYLLTNHSGPILLSDVSETYDYDVSVEHQLSVVVSLRFGHS